MERRSDGSAIRIAALIALAGALGACERSRDCYPMCPQGYHPSGCSCVPAPDAASSAPSAGAGAPDASADR